MSPLELTDNIQMLLQMILTVDGYRRRMITNLEKYPIFNSNSYLFYVENPEVYPPRVRNAIEKFHDRTFRYEIVDPKVQYLWSIKDHYNLPPIDALKHELGNIIKSNKMIYHHESDEFYCLAKDKFRIEFFNPGTAEERIVVIFGTYEKQMELLNAGVILFTVTLGASCTLPALSVKALLVFYSTIAANARETNPVDFNPQNAVKAGAINGTTTFMLDGFMSSIWNFFGSFK
jgi:hypothetical protein